VPRASKIADFGQLVTVGGNLRSIGWELNLKRAVDDSTPSRACVEAVEIGAFALAS